MSKMTVITQAWQKQIVHVPRDGTALDVEADTFGCFALIEMRRLDEAWTDDDVSLTHIPTGARLEIYTMDCVDVLRDAAMQYARDVAESLMRECGGEWNTESFTKARALAVQTQKVWKL